MRKNPWNDNRIQFPRLIAEINAEGLTKKQLESVSASMDLTIPDVIELFNRAEDEFEKIKRGKMK